ncbi:MAG: CoB--CoM heterodisulfide reductase iron-sulfur subunit B family protein [Deltaproteobacteria bacterium]|nr:CoB--CoM heterodisulfide reductase iron-sulfur subunit B family protein [Deltaproteobacteria bacterium]
MKDFALFRCCPTAVFLKQYETSTEAVLRKLGVPFLDIHEFNCCGYPLKNFDFKAYILASARNLSLAEKKGVHVLTFCNCCYNSLKQARHHLNQDGALREEINRTLGKEGLSYGQGMEVKHLFEVLLGDIGVEHIKARVIKTFKGLKIATHYGCHLLRPSRIICFDKALAPSKFDQLVEITGAESIPWRLKLECCGSPLLGIDDDLSLDLTQNKIQDAGQSGADYLCSACVYCQIQFDRVQERLVSGRSIQPLPSILYTQLLGLSLGIGEEDLGINLNALDLSGIVTFLS